MTNVVKFERWEAIVEILHGGKPIEDIFLSGVGAPDKATASRLVAERAHLFVKSGNYQAGTQIRIRDLEREGATPKNQASPAAIAKRPVIDMRHSSKTSPVNAPRWQPFKCPIINLCQTRMEGKRAGTAIRLTEAKQEK